MTEYFPEIISSEAEKKSSKEITIENKAQEESDDAKLDRLDSLLDQLPKELYEKWSSYADSVSVDEALEKVQEIVLKRQKALNGVRIHHVHHDSEISQILEQNVNEEIQDINMSLNDPSCFLGEGQVAKVVRSHKIDHLCFKIVHDMTSYNKGNNIYQEGMFLEELEDFEVDGVRTPSVYFYVDRVDMVGIGMEALDAVSVVDVFNQPDLLLELRSKGFVIDAFMESLKKYIAEMHKKKIYHRDLFSRNVMIDMETLKPRVIDFGKAKKAYFDSEIGNSDISDLEGIKIIKKNLRKAWNGEYIDFSENV